MSAFGSRLKEARLQAGFSQEQLGIEAGLDPMYVSARMNRYELGKRVPDHQVTKKFALVLGVPAAYFYATEEDEAQLLSKYYLRPTLKRQKL